MTAQSPVQLDPPVVYIVDDEDVVRSALAWLLRSRRLLSEGFSSAEAFQEKLEGYLKAAAANGSVWPTAPTCLLLDMRLPGASGMALFDRLAELKLPKVMQVIFLTGHGDVSTAVASVKRGAFDFVEKPFSDNALVDRVEQALRRSALVIQQQHEQMEVRRRLNELTERERAVMRGMVEGGSNKAIAEMLNISVRTVEVHRARVFEKMQLKSAVDLANLLRGEKF